MSINNTAKRILLAEDDPSISEIVSIILKEENYEVYTPADYNILQKLLNEQEFNLILLDMSLWGIDGEDILKYIKSKPKQEHANVILMSARSDIKSYVDKFGVTDVIEKPFEVSILLQTVKKYIK